MSEKLTIDLFVEKSRLKHGIKYDYSLVQYIDCDTKVKIICPIHGVFEQTPYRHLTSCGCTKCGHDNRVKSIKNNQISFEDLILTLQKVHHNKYDYSLNTSYNNLESYLNIICPTHGLFKQKIHGHKIGQGCKKCAIDLLFSSQEDFILKCNIIHNYKYDYSLVKYINCYSTIKIICPEHGIFEQMAQDHKRGRGCTKCYLKRNTKTRETFIFESNNVHNNKYIYDNSKYINCDTKVEIICPKHGSFWQTPTAHLYGCGCKKCGYNYSKGEEKIENYLKRYNINYLTQHKFDNCKGIRQRLRFDFYLPDHNICIEFDGIYHYEPIHGIIKFNKSVERDKIKTKYCLDNNIKLIRIPYWDDRKIDQILSIMINPEVKNIPDPQQII